MHLDLLLKMFFLISEMIMKKTSVRLKTRFIQTLLLMLEMCIIKVLKLHQYKANC